MNLIKVPFCFINIIFLLLSICVFGFGIFLLTDETIIDQIISISNLSEALKIASNETRSDPFHLDLTDPISYIFMSFGSLIFFLSFIGYCGALKDSRCLMAAYGLVLISLFLLEIVTLVLYLEYKPDVKTYISKGIKDHYSPEDRPSGARARFTIYMDFLMIKNKCCGISGEMDFENLYKPYEDEMYEEKGKIALMQRIPEACCHLNISSIEMSYLYTEIYQNPNTTRKELLEYADDRSCIVRAMKDVSYVGEDSGCFDKIQRDWSTQLILTGVVVGILQLCGIVFSFFIFRAAYYDYMS